MKNIILLVVLLMVLAVGFPSMDKPVNKITTQQRSK